MPKAVQVGRKMATAMLKGVVNEERVAGPKLGRWRVGFVDDGFWRIRRGCRCGGEVSQHFGGKGCKGNAGEDGDDGS